MLNLIEPNKNESLSVDARQELDLRIGCAFTRFQTRFFQGKYGDLDASLVSYGPCQTPTLTFCVDRMDKIKSFKPETFWYLDLELQSPLENDARTFNAKWARVHLFDKEVTYMFYSDLKVRVKLNVYLYMRLFEKDLSYFSIIILDSNFLYIFFLHSNLRSCILRKNLKINLRLL